jgi:hypothetical protein
LELPKEIPPDDFTKGREPTLQVFFVEVLLMGELSEEGLKHSRSV